MKNVREFSVKTKNDKLAYLPGETLRGELFVSFEEETEVKSIKIFLQGVGAGQWLEQSGTAVLTEKTQDGDGKIAKQTLVDIGLRAFGNSSRENKKITPVHDKGRYVYEFQFRVPETLPPTFRSPIEKDLGYVRYYLQAVLQRPRKTDRKSHIPVVINQLILPDRPELKILPGSSNKKPVTTNCMSTGTLLLEVYLSKSHFVQGDKILINATAENESTKQMKELYAKLIRRVWSKARFGTKTYTVEVAIVHGDRIPPSKSRSWKNKELTVPCIGPTYSKHEDIRVDYLVRVGMYEDYGAEIHLDLPVVIGTVGTKEEMQTRQEQEALEEFIEKQRRSDEIYRLRRIKAEERIENRKELYHLIGPFDPINVADRAPEDGRRLVKQNRDGSQVLFSDERPGRRTSKGNTGGEGNRSKSAEELGTSDTNKRARSKSGERSTSLEGGMKRKVSSGSLSNQKAVAAPSKKGGSTGKLSSTSSLPTSGSKEKLNNRLGASRESIKSAGLNRSHSKERNGSSVTAPGSSKQPGRGRGDKQKQKPEWNATEKVEHARPSSKSDAPTTTTGLGENRSRAAAQRKMSGTSPRSSSLENKDKRKTPTEGGSETDRRASVASLYVYRGSVSSECDVPLTYSRSRSKNDWNDDEDVCEEDLIQSLLTTNEGRNALADGRPLSREGRRRLQGGGETSGINKNSKIIPMSTEPAKKDDNAENDNKPDTQQQTTKGGSNNNVEQEPSFVKGSSDEHTQEEPKQESASVKKVAPNKGTKTTSQSKGSIKTTPQKVASSKQQQQQLQQQQNQEPPQQKQQQLHNQEPPQQQQQQGGNKTKAHVEEEPLIDALQERAVESTPSINFSEVDPRGQEEEKSKSTTGNGEHNSKIPQDGNNTKDRLKPYALKARDLNKSSEENEDDGKPSERTQEEMKRLQEFEHFESVFERLSPSLQDKNNNLSPVENYDEFQESGRGFLFQSQKQQHDGSTAEGETDNQGKDTPRPTDVPRRLPSASMSTTTQDEIIEDGEAYEHQGLLDVPMSPIHEETAEYEQSSREYAPKALDEQDLQDEGEQTMDENTRNSQEGQTIKEDENDNSTDTKKTSVTKLPPASSLVLPEWDASEKIKYTKPGKIIEVVPKKAKNKSPNASPVSVSRNNTDKNKDKTPKSTPTKKRVEEKNNSNKKVVCEAETTLKASIVGAELGIIGDHLEEKNKQARREREAKQQQLMDSMQQCKPDRNSKEGTAEQNLQKNKKKTRDGEKELVNEDEALCCQSKPEYAEMEDDQMLRILEGGDQQKDNPLTTQIEENEVPSKNKTNDKKNADSDLKETLSFEGKAEELKDGTQKKESKTEEPGTSKDPVHQASEKSENGENRSISKPALQNNTTQQEKSRVDNTISAGATAKDLPSRDSAKQSKQNSSLEESPKGTEDGNRASKTKTSPWGFFGGAVGKFLYKLKPQKNQQQQGQGGNADDANRSESPSSSENSKSSNAPGNTKPTSKIIDESGPIQSDSASTTMKPQLKVKIPTANGNEEETPAASISTTNVKAGVPAKKIIEEDTIECATMKEEESARIEMRFDNLDDVNQGDGSANIQQALIDVEIPKLHNAHSPPEKQNSQNSQNNNNDKKTPPSGVNIKDATKLLSSNKKNDSPGDRNKQTQKETKDQKQPGFTINKQKSGKSKASEPSVTTTKNTPTTKKDKGTTQNSTTQSDKISETEQEQQGAEENRPKNNKGSTTLQEKLLGMRKGEKNSPSPSTSKSSSSVNKTVPNTNNKNGTPTRSPLNSPTCLRYGKNPSHSPASTRGNQTYSSGENRETEGRPRSSEGKGQKKPAMQIDRRPGSSERIQSPSLGSHHQQQRSNRYQSPVQSPLAGRHELSGNESPSSSSRGGARIQSPTIRATTKYSPVQSPQTQHKRLQQQQLHDSGFDDLAKGSPVSTRKQRGNTNSPLSSPSMSKSRIPTKSPASSSPQLQRGTSRPGSITNSRSGSTNNSRPGSTNNSRPGSGRDGGRSTTSSPSSIGRGRSPNKRDSTHGLKTRALNNNNNTRSKDTGSPKNTSKENHQPGKSQKPHHHQHQQTQQNARDVDLDSLDSQRSTTSEARANTDKKAENESPMHQRQKDNHSTPAKSNLPRSTTKKNKRSKSDSGTGNSPPKRIVCYYPPTNNSDNNSKIPGAGVYGRQSSISSVDSLFSVSSYSGERGSNREEKTGGKIPIRQSPHKNNELFNKENAFASGVHHHAERYPPKLETAVERQRWIDEMVLKSGTKPSRSNSSASNGKQSKKSATQKIHGIVKSDSPGFMNYAHNAPLTSSSKGHVVKVSPKIMDFPYRCHVTQAPSNDIVEPRSPSIGRQRKDPYAHIQSPTKRLMTRSPAKDGQSTEKHRTKPRQPSPRKSSRSPVKRTTQNDDPTTRSLSSEKIPYVSPYKQSKQRSNSAKREASSGRDNNNIVMFSYNPDCGAALNSSSSESGGNEVTTKNTNDAKQATIFNKEQYWRRGGKDGSKENPTAAGKVPSGEKDGEKQPKSKNLHEKKFAVSNLMGKHPGKVTTEQMQERHDNNSLKKPRHPRAKSENDIPLNRQSPHTTTFENNNSRNPMKMRASRSLESPRRRNYPSADGNNGTPTSTTPYNYAERRRRSLARQQERDERLRNLRDQFNAEKTVFVEHASHPNADPEKEAEETTKLSHSYPTYKTKPRSVLKKTQGNSYSSTEQPLGYDHLRGGYGTSGGNASSAENAYRRLPDLPPSELTQSMNNDRSAYQHQNEQQDQPIDNKRLYPGLSNSYDHLNFNYHSPFYRSRSTPGQLRGETSEFSHSFDARELRETWCPTDYVGYVESRGEARPYMGHIERLDQYNCSYYNKGNNHNGKSNSRSSDDLLSEGKSNYKLNTPYATSNDRLADAYDYGELQLPNVPLGKESVLKRMKNTDNNKRQMVKEDLINFSSEAILGDDDGNTSYTDDLFNDINKSINDTAKENNFDRDNGARKQRYLEEDLLRRASPTGGREIPPPSQVKPLNGGEKGIPKCPVRPSHIPYHVTMEGDYVPRSTPVHLPDEECSRKEGPRKEPHRVTFKPNQKIQQQQRQPIIDPHKAAKQTPSSDTSSVKITETQKLPAVCVNEETTNKPSTYIPSIDNGVPYIDSVVQNTSSSLIEDGIVPYNFFPIICSSHLPKKVMYPIDEKDLSSVRSKSKSPERSAKQSAFEESNKKKRSRSHSPRSLRDSVLLKRQRKGSQRGDEKDGGTKSDTTNSQTQQQETPTISVAMEDEEVRALSDDLNGSNDLNGPNKDTKQKNVLVKKTTKKKKKTSSLPVSSHHKSKVRSPRIVMRENARKQKHQQPQQEYVIFRDQRESQSNEPTRKQERPTIADRRQDSSSSQYDDRIVIGGGLTFSSPVKHGSNSTTTKKRSSKKTPNATKNKKSTKFAKPKTTSKAKQMGIGNNQQKRNEAELQFFENISQIEQNSKTLEEDLREISRMQERERQIENTTPPLLYNTSNSPYSIAGGSKRLPPRAVPQPALAPESSSFNGIFQRKRNNMDAEDAEEDPANISTSHLLPEEKELVDWGRRGDQHPEKKMFAKGGKRYNNLDASSLSEKELIELITQEIDQQEKKNTGYQHRGEEVINPPPSQTSCGFKGKSSSNLLPHEQNNLHPIMTRGEGFYNNLNGGVDIAEENEQDDGVLGVPHLTREERANKRNLEKQMKDNTVVATPIIRSGQISALEERTLRQRFENANIMPDKNNKNTTYTFSSVSSLDNHHQQQQQTPSYFLKLPRRSKDDSYDSFEHHERYFGIIDEQGEARNNSQLLDASYTDKQLQKRQRQRQRKNERLQKDLENARNPRRASCPGTFGLREGFSFSDDVYNSEANTIESIDELKTSKRQEKLKEANNNNLVKAEENPKTKNQVVNPAAKITQQQQEVKEKPQQKKLPRSSKTTSSIPMGAFAYEEEIIETYKYTEETRPLTSMKQNLVTTSTRLDLGEGSLSFDVPIVTSESNFTDSDRSKVTATACSADEAWSNASCSDRETLREETSGIINRKAHSTVATTPHSPTDDERYRSNSFSFVYKPSCTYTCSKESPRRSGIPRWTPRT